VICQKGILVGTITDVSEGSPIQGAQIDADGYTTFSNDSGFYRLCLPEDTYDVTASALCYSPETQTGVIIQDGETTIVNFALDTGPSSEVSGTVTDADTGWPFYAKIDYGVGTV
jgi:hypothetical protein